MNKKTWYPNENEVHEIYNKTMEISDNTYNGIVNPGALNSILNHIQNDDYYPDFIDKLNHLFVSITKFHCFRDGNKRSAIALSTAFLIFNGYSGALKEFIVEMEQFVVLVASDAMSKELCQRVIESIISGEYGEDEFLKIDIIKAFTKHEEIMSQFD